MVAPRGATLRVGVLALQGDFREHAQVLRVLGADVTLVRRPEELAAVDGLVIPGGESSVMDKLARTFGLAEPLRAAIRGGLPVYGTCAGLIMLADTVLDGIRGQESLGGLDVVGAPQRLRLADAFLRDRPRRARARGRARCTPSSSARRSSSRSGRPRPPLATLEDGRCVAVEQGNLLGTSLPPRGDGRLPHPRVLPRQGARGGLIGCRIGVGPVGHDEPMAANRYVALLRGINVNGVKILSVDLAELFRTLGLHRGEDRARQRQRAIRLRGDGCRCD